jgi:hypothetical protein
MMTKNEIKTIDIAQAESLPAARPLDGQSIKIGLVQVNNSFSGQNYLPYSLACLRSYIESHAPDATRYQFLPSAPFASAPSINHTIQR